MADSPRPGVWALEKSMDNGNTSLVNATPDSDQTTNTFLNPFVTFVISNDCKSHLIPQAPPGPPGSTLHQMTENVKGKTAHPLFKQTTKQIQ